MQGREETGLGVFPLEPDNESSWTEAPIAGAEDSPVQTLESQAAAGNAAGGSELEEEGPVLVEAFALEEPVVRTSLEAEEALCVAIEHSLRALLGELVDFELGFRQVLRLGEQLAAGELRLRSVVDLSGNLESEDDEEEDSPGGATGRTDAAIRRTLRTFEAVARLRQSYLRLAASHARPTASVRAQLTARRAELITRIERLSIHPNQLRQIDARLGELLSSQRQAEQALVALVRGSGRRPGKLPASVRAWRRAVGPRVSKAQSSLTVLKELEREAGEPLGQVREKARAVRRAHRELENAKSQMVRSNLGMVRAIAARYHHRGLDPTDLLQEGSIGLMRAVERFDYHRGFRFSTYAQWWVRQAITRAIADQGRTVRVPVHMNEQHAQLRRLSSFLSQKHGRPATIEEVAEAAAVTPEKVAATLRYLQTTLSLDAPVNADSEASLLDLVPDPNSADPTIAADQVELQRRLEDALSNLPVREQQVLRMRFGIGATYLGSLEEIGQVLGVTRERIRQIELKALKRLQKRGRGLKLESFLAG